MFWSWSWILWLWKEKKLAFFSPLLSSLIYFLNAFNDSSADFPQVEVERIDIGEPETTGMYIMVKRFL